MIIDIECCIFTPIVPTIILIDTTLTKTRMNEETERGREREDRDEWEVHERDAGKDVQSTNMSDCIPHYLISTSFIASIVTGVVVVMMACTIVLR